MSAMGQNYRVARRADSILPRNGIDAPRRRPQTSWSEIGIYGATAITSALLLASVLF